METFDDLVSKLSEAYGMSKKAMHNLAISVVDGVVKIASEVGKCYVGRANYFKKVIRKPKRYRNVNTGELEVTKEQTLVSFKKKIA